MEAHDIQSLVWLLTWGVIKATQNIGHCGFKEQELGLVNFANRFGYFFVEGEEELIVIHTRPEILVCAFIDTGS